MTTTKTLSLIAQRDCIARHLQHHCVITAIEALQQYGCFRLAARIHELRANGWDIETLRHADGYAIYQLKSDASTTSCK